MNKSCILIFILSLFISRTFYAQDGDSVHSLSLQDRSYPHYLTDEEKSILHDYVHPLPKESITDPPSFAVRTMAEWEDLQGILITWTSYFDILSQIVDHAQEEGLVYIITSNPNAVLLYLNKMGVPLINLQFIQESFNTIWVRDYGPWSVYSKEDNSLHFVDWIYNRPRPLDDVIPEKFAVHYDIPLYSTISSPNDLINTGGNFMVDGKGTAFSSKLILEENPSKTEIEIDSIMHSFMGIERFVKFDTLLFDLIHHIDMHIKLLNEETLLVGEYPEGIADGPQIEENIQYLLKNYQTCFGNAYNIVRIPMPADEFGNYPDNGGKYRTYTNSVIVNKTVIVPIYDCIHDSLALSIYRNSMPGYKIAGIECNSIIPDYGAIHCITKEIGAEYPERPRAHYAQLNKNFMQLNMDSLTVNCRVKHFEENNFSVMAVYHSVDEQYCDSVELVPGNISKRTEDGFMIYRGQIQPLDIESDYFITLKTQDHDFGKNNIVNRAARFTTIGPVESSEVPYIDYYYRERFRTQKIRLVLHNNASEAAAVNLWAKISTTDPRVSKILTATQSFPDLPAGKHDTTETNKSYSFNYSENYESDSTVHNPIHFDVTIFSNGYPYWDSSFEYRAAIGPVRLADPAFLDVAYEDSAARQKIRLVVQNNGPGTTVHNLKATIKTSDPRIEEITDSTQTFPDLPFNASDTSSIENLYSFRYAEGYGPASTSDNPVPFDVTITSNDSLQWNSSFDFVSIFVGVGDDELRDVPETFTLHQNYPNPFNPNTTIKFALAESEYTTLKVYNILGKEVAQLVSGNLRQGKHTYNFDGSNLASGVYYYHLVAGDYRKVRKMLLVK